jgi:integrase
VFYRATWVPGSGRDVKSLGTRDRAEAERLGRQLLAALASGPPPVQQGPVRLGDLVSRYVAESAGYHDNKPRTRKEDRARLAMIVTSIGAARDVRTISADVWGEHVRRRRAGGIRTDGGRLTGPVGARSIEADYRALNTVLRWACTVPVGANGGRLIDRNPLSGVRCAREKNPTRSVATWDRYVAMRRAIRELADADTDDARRDWLMLEFALVIAEATGRREGSLRCLRWEDIDDDADVVRWRAESDKGEVAWESPLTDSLRDEIAAFREQLGGHRTGLVFPSPRRVDQPLGRTWFDRRFVRAEQAAGLTKLPRARWHAFRRKWATERKHHPLKDVAAAGGWKNTQTLLTCYQQPDADTLRRVLDEHRKLRDRGLLDDAPAAAIAREPVDKRRQKRHLALVG